MQGAVTGARCRKAEKSTETVAEWREDDAHSKTCMSKPLLERCVFPAEVGFLGTQNPLPAQDRDGDKDEFANCFTNSYGLSFGLGSASFRPRRGSATTQSEEKDEMVEEVF